MQTHKSARATRTPRAVKSKENIIHNFYRRVTTTLSLYRSPFSHLVRNIIIAIVVILVLLLSLAIYGRIEMSAPPEYGYNIPVSINYSGSWKLVYWVTPPEKVMGKMTGSGNYETTIAFMSSSVVTLCANATKLVPRNNLTLTLSITGLESHNTSDTNPTAKVCGSMFTVP